jgi:acyl-CoA synthetase (AMP-forming)/AMP-acid ligase II
MVTEIQPELAGVESLVELLRRRAQRQPRQLALNYLSDNEGEQPSLTYEQLERAAVAVAGALRQLCAPGERALLLFHTGPEFIASFFGCLYAGVIAVPVCPPRPKDSLQQLRAIAAESGATLALTTSDLHSKLESRIDELPDLDALSWQRFDQLDAAGAPNDYAPTPETLALLQFTSGSTSSPKGVMVTHKNLLVNLRMIQQGFDFKPGFVKVSWLPHYHDMGLIGGMLSPIFMGGTVHLMSPASFLQRPVRWLRAVTQYQAGCIGSPNFGYDYCATRIPPEQCEGLDLSTLRQAYCGSEPIRSNTLTAFVEKFAPHGFRREAFYPCYGLAEATLFVTGVEVTEPPRVRYFDGEALEDYRAVPCPPEARGARALVSCGHAPPRSKVVIVERDSRTPLPDGQLGEVWVSGPHIAAGYWGRDDATRETFGAFLSDGEGPFMRTGDVGFMDGRELYVTGRYKDLIIIDGRNLYPQDVELTVRQAQPTAQRGHSAAISVDIDGRERLVILMELERKMIAALGLNGTKRVTLEELAQGHDAGPWAEAGQVEGLTTISRAVREAVSEEHGVAVYDLIILPTGGIPVTTSGKTKRYVCRRAYITGKLGRPEGPTRARFLNVIL